VNKEIEFEKLIMRCESVKKLLDAEQPNQKYFTGIVKDVYDLMNEIIIEAEQKRLYKKSIFYDDIARLYADETIDYYSSIYTELDRIERLLSKSKIAEGSIKLVGKVMNYSFLKVRSENSFYPVTVEEINEIENELGISLPKDLKDLYLEVGYGFIKGSEYNVNRVLDPYSIRDLSLKQNDFQYIPDIEIYSEFEQDKLLFFKANESALMSIGLSENDNAIYYCDVRIAESLKEFLYKIQENDKYYFEFGFEK